MSPRPFSCLLCGLTGAGATTLLTTTQWKSSGEVRLPRIAGQFGIAAKDIDAVEVMHTVDAGGQSPSAWKTHLLSSSQSATCQIVVFLVDASDPDRFKQSAAALWTGIVPALTESKGNSTRLIVLINKIDLLDAESQEVMISASGPLYAALRLNELASMVGDYRFTVIPTSTLNGTGCYNPLIWIRDNVAFPIAAQAHTKKAGR